ncbi:MAG: Farnesyl diphosphate synthase [Paracidovorax wautersii]|uniref:Farnesyl diphosphate synthase n=1 Tax=Paracidovorax wautersii TaxID=1177982 RepID=A0A7V8FQJ9_9BURK|nr:MAG: Farnesyl diphosphate synthase [Paracidovorax wautersii]
MTVHDGVLAHAPAFDAAAWMQARQAALETALERWVGAGAPPPLAEPMRYAVLGGGKRLRALLVVAAAEAVQGSVAAALRAACAVELIHAYSLVHDDMPCMDNDVLRRGKPTVHVQFGQAQALLAGDALQAQAFELLTPDDEPHGTLAIASADADALGAHEVLPPAVQADLCRLLARAAGARGMAGGQAIDLASVGLRLSSDELQTMHRLKTGALLQASVLMGAACGEPDAAARRALGGYGAAIGLAFQVMDDVLDVTADTQTLGKTAGKDQASDKPTYVSLLGLDAARAYAGRLLDEALTALADSGLAHTAALQALARRVVGRAH